MSHELVVRLFLWMAGSCDSMTGTEEGRGRDGPSPVPPPSLLRPRFKLRESATVLPADPDELEEATFSPAKSRLSETRKQRCRCDHFCMARSVLVHCARERGAGGGM